MSGMYLIRVEKTEKYGERGKRLFTTTPLSEKYKTVTEFSRQTKALALHYETIPINLVDEKEKKVKN